MEFLKDIIAVGTIISFAITIFAKFIPNDKVYAFGVKLGQMADSFGHARLGGTWEKLEDFFINSLGQLFSGIKYGLDAPKDLDDPDVEPKDPPVEENTNVRR